jgi:HD-GYP domain-containing protein (c-di-GMP phosphodiesterase class II)
MRTDQAGEAATQSPMLEWDELLQVLGMALDFRDNETGGHSQRVTRYCLEIAAATGCQAEEMNQIARAAYLHDIGKIAIPDAILQKKGRLTPEETEVMRTHAWIGYNLISRLSFLAPVAAVVLAHHERYDGKGYPRGAKGGEIPLGARIFAVADTLDAMTTDRPYRKARPFSVARDEIIRESGHQFDPSVVEAFLSIPEDAIRGVVLREKRRSVRLPLRTEVTCKANGQQHRLASANISEGGMLLEKANGLKVGQELELEFGLPQAAALLNLRGKVVRRDLPDRIAIAFARPSPVHLEAIKSYIAGRVQV